MSDNSFQGISFSFSPSMERSALIDVSGQAYSMISGKPFNIGDTLVMSSDVLSRSLVTIAKEAGLNPMETVVYNNLTSAANSILIHQIKSHYEKGRI